MFVSFNTPTPAYTVGFMLFKRAHNAQDLGSRRIEQYLFDAGSVQLQPQLFALVELIR
jgi:hypothetical protein